MVEVQIMNIHDFMSVEEGFSMLLSVEFAAQDLLPVGSASCTSFKFVQVCFFITKHYAGTRFRALNRGSSFLLDAPPQTVIP